MTKPRIKRTNAGGIDTIIRKALFLLIFTTLLLLLIQGVLHYELKKLKSSANESSQPNLKAIQDWKDVTIRFAIN